MTKEIETSETIIATLEAKLAAAEAQLAQQARQYTGWLVVTPNAAYSGTMFDHQITFNEGWCFLADDQEIPFFQPELLSDEQMQRRYTPEEIEEINRNLAARSTSKRCVDALVNDFGYTATYFSKDQKLELDAAIAEQHKKFLVANERLSATQKAMRNALQERHFIGLNQ